MKGGARLAILVLIAAVTVACTPAPATPTPTPAPPPTATAAPDSLEMPSDRLLPFDELVMNPEPHVGERLCTEGVMMLGAGVEALAATAYSNGIDMFLSEPAIWIEGALQSIDGECLQPGGPETPRFCRAIVCGRLEYGDFYGPDGLYAYQIH